MEEEVRHEDLAFMGVLIKRHREIGGMEVLPGFANLIAKPARGKSHHLPRKLVGRVTLSSPKAVGSISLLQTAPFVFLAAAAGARVIPADLLVAMKGHDRVTLPRDIREGKQLQNLRQKHTFIHGGRAFRHWGVLRS
ncbi:MAG: hypothetical protein WB869_05980 [Candidatus Acidiferrales bacterium]